MPALAKSLWLPIAALGLLGGCPAAPPAMPTTVELVNSTGLDLRPGFYTSASAQDAAGLFVPANLVTDFTTRAFPELRGGESVSLTLECDQIRSLGVDAPVGFDALTLTPTRSDDRIFLQRDTDFDCGATLRFVYSIEDGALHVRLERQ